MFSELNFILSNPLAWSPLKDSFGEALKDVGDQNSGEILKSKQKLEKLVTLEVFVLGEQALQNILEVNF